MKDIIETPHVVEGRPCCVACNPRYARVKGGGAIITSTHNKPPPGQEGEAVASYSMRQVRDGAAVGGRTREQFNRGEVAAITKAANYQLTWCKVQDELIKTMQELQIFSTCNIAYNGGMKGEWHSTFIVWVPLRSTC